MADSMDVDQQDDHLMTQQPQQVGTNGTLPLGTLTDGQLSRRRSMSEEQERERRASIKAILADTSITPSERRRSIQHLMDGRRSSMGTNSVTSSSSSHGATGGEFDLDHAAAQYGYGYANGGGPTQAMPNVMMINGVPVPANAVNASGAMMMDPSAMGQNGYGPTTALFPAYVEQCIPICNEATKLAEQTRPRCAHYDRNCTMVAPCCGAAFGCRICHDESPVLPPLLMMKASRKYPRSSSLPGSFTTMQTAEETHHSIDRFAVMEVICRECCTKQSSKTNNCVNCNVQFGEYHCSICNLWMSNDEKPYHCKDCGFCRVGGAEKFQHCHDCGMCIDKSLYSNHNCKSGKYKSNCPVCQEFLFSSRSASHEMPCGHAIHWECFRQLAAHDSRCPVCKKTAETRERMLPTWNAMAAGVAFQAVPPELARVVNITCIDCAKSDDGRAWHFLGVQCRNCSSFNTVVDRIVMSGEEAHEFLETLQTRTDLTETEDGNDRINRRRINRRRSLF